MEISISGGTRTEYDSEGKELTYKGSVDGTSTHKSSYTGHNPDQVTFSTRGHVSGPDFYERICGITATVTVALSLSGSNSIDDSGCRIDLSVTK